MVKNIFKVMIIWLPLIGFSTSADASRKGASVTIRHGIVENTEQVKFNSRAAGGALVGGIIGYNWRSSGSSSKRRRNAVIGAAAGAAARSAAEGDLTGTQYTVKANDGSYIKIVTDQTEIRKGDCVAVEQSGDTGNIRRVDKSLCSKDAKKVEQAVAEESQEEAAECLAAKQEMLDANTDDQINLAMQKIKVLCNN